MKISMAMIGRETERKPSVKLTPGQTGTIDGYSATVIRHYDGNMYEIMMPGGLTVQDATYFVPSEKKRKTNPMKAFSATQISRLKSEYSKINRINSDSEQYEKLVVLLDGLDLDSLKNLANADIKFVSSLARNRVFRRTNERKTNPEAKDAFLYIVYVCDANKKPVYDIAKFRKLSEAKSYAKAYVTSANKPVCIESKKL